MEPAGTVLKNTIESGDTMSVIQNPQGHDFNAKAEQNLEQEVDLVELFFRLLENWKYIFLAALVGAIFSGIYTFQFVTPIYEATSKLYVTNSGDSAINLADLQIGTYLASDYQEVFKTWEVHEMVIANLNLSLSQPSWKLEKRQQGQEASKTLVRPIPV